MALHQFIDISLLRRTANDMLAPIKNPAKAGFLSNSFIH